MLSKIALATGVVAVLSLAHTAEVQAQTTDINPWQHCGIGAMIFDDNTTAAAISNIIWDSGTTAISSATITPEACNSQELQVAQFIDETYDVLATETAMGEGQHIAAVLELAGCQMNAEAVAGLRAGLSDDLQQAGFATAAHEDKAFNYYQTVQQVAAGCSAS